MPFSLVDVPVNGDGTPIDLSTYGFVKTFIASGPTGPIDGFDALIMVDTGVGYIPVGRIRGSEVVTVKAWGYNFFLRRLDDGANAPFPAQVTVQAAVSPGAILSPGAVPLTEAAPEQQSDLGAATEPITVTCNSDSKGTVLVLGKSTGGVDAPLATIVPGQAITVNAGIDINFIVFRLLNIDDSNGVITCQTWAKAQEDNINTQAEGRFSLADGVGASQLRYQSSKVVTGFNGNISNPASGIFDIELNGPLMTNQPICFCAVSPGIGPTPTRWTIRASADAIAANAVRVEILDAGGNHVDPAGCIIYVKVDF